MISCFHFPNCICLPFWILQYYEAWTLQLLFCKVTIFGGLCYCLLSVDCLLDWNYTAVWSIQVCYISEWKLIAMICSMKGYVHRIWMNRKAFFIALWPNAYKYNRTAGKPYHRLFYLIYPLSFYVFCPLHGTLPSSQPHRTERFLRRDPGSLNVLSVESSNNWRCAPQWTRIFCSKSSFMSHCQQFWINFWAYRCTHWRVRMLSKLLRNWWFYVRSLAISMLPSKHGDIVPKCQNCNMVLRQRARWRDTHPIMVQSDPFLQNRKHWSYYPVHVFFSMTY